MFRYVPIFLFLPATGFAAMSGEDFEAYVNGRTLTYADGGVVYGIEEYLPGRRVRWAFVGDQCVEGFWYDTGQEICFVYEDRPNNTQCWEFKQESDGLSALFSNGENGRKLYEIKRSSEPLTCLGPDVGV